MSRTQQPDVGWHGTLPTRWERRRLKTLCKMRSGSAITRDSIEATGIYPVFGGNGLRGYTSSFTHDGRYPLVGRQGALCGNVHLVAGKFWASEHAVVVTPRAGVDGAWLSKLLETMDLGQHSIAAAQPGLAVERIMQLPAFIPDQEEQKLIVRYLDNAELRLQQAISAKQQLLVLLDEQRKVVVDELLRGAHLGIPAAEYTESGIPGLETLPSSWSIVPAKTIWKFTDRRSQTGQEERLSVSSRSGVVPRSSKTVTMFEAESYIGHKLVEPGQLVINSLWAWAGGLGVSEYSGIVSPVYGVYSMLHTDSTNAAYFHELLRSNLMQWQFQVRSKGIWRSRLQLSREAFLSMPIVNPPRPDQDRVAAEIQARTSSLQSAEQAIQEEIRLLNEYRTRLISDVVTGRKDIRKEAEVMKDVDPDELQALYTSTTSARGETEPDDE